MRYGLRRVTLRPILVGLAIALGLLLAACGGGDDEPAATTSPPITSGPLASGEPEALVRRALRRLLSGSYRANSSTRVELSAEDAPDDVVEAARETEVQVDLRIEAESPRRRSLRLTISAGQSDTFATIVEHDGEAFLSVDDRDYRALAPELVETLGGSGAMSIDPLLDSLGDLTDAGDAERGGQPVRAYEAPLDVAYLRDNAGSTFGGSAAGATFTGASARFELQTADGLLAFQGIYARAERDLSRVRDDLEGTLVADLSVTIFAMDHGERLAIERPTPTGDPIRTRDQLTRALR